MRQFCKSLFPVVAYAYCTIPTYPSGQIGFMLCSKNPVSFEPSRGGGPGRGWRGGVGVLRVGTRAVPDARAPGPRTPTSGSPCSS